MGGAAPVSPHRPCDDFGSISSRDQQHELPEPVQSKCRPESDTHQNPFLNRCHELGGSKPEVAKDEEHFNSYAIKEVRPERSTPAPSRGRRGGVCPLFLEWRTGGEVARGE